MIYISFDVFVISPHCLKLHLSEKCVNIPIFLCNWLEGSDKKIHFLSSQGDTHKFLLITQFHRGLQFINSYTKILGGNFTPEKILGH
jgi:hypothetical protein